MARKRFGAEQIVVLLRYGASSWVARCSRAATNPRVDNHGEPFKSAG
jgi:hypothetical protein